jgi:hypothetical protein
MKECNQGKAVVEACHEANLGELCHHLPLSWFQLVNEVVICRNVDMRRSNKLYKLYLVVFKPHRFLCLYSLESDQVKTKWFIKGSSNHMNGKNGPSESSKGAIIGHSYSAAYGNYFYLQDMLTSSWRIGGWARANPNETYDYHCIL